MNTSAKRRDARGRVLRTGEQQRADGRYLFTYVGNDGKTHYEYSWTLEPTDRIPSGKRKGLSLREKEKQIKKDMDDAIAYHADNMTMLTLVQRYIGTRTGVKKSTKAGYATVVRCLQDEEIAYRRIDTIKELDAREFMIYLQETKKKSYSTIHTIRGVVRPAFQLAVQDDLIRKNPFDFPLSEVLYNDSVRREALSREDERIYLDFIKNDSHYKRYYDGIFILFNTGMRISEWCGLTVGDVDMEGRKIKITHQLQRGSDMVYEIITPKTAAGNRELPMTEEVYQCFKRILKKRAGRRVEPSFRDESGKIYTGFLFLDKNGMPMVAMHWEKYFQLSVEKYNKIYKRQLPKITPHIARHTYCTNQARRGMSPKALQYLMGHSEIETTLNVYTHLKYEDAKEEFEKLQKQERKAAD